MTKAPRFVVYHVGSTMEKKRFYHATAAHKFAEKLNAYNSYDDRYLYVVTGIEDYLANVVKMVERTNLMTGKKYMEPTNTPGYMSPASEAYWSM